MPFLSHHILEVRQCPQSITTEVSHHLVQVAFVRFLHFRVTIFSFPYSFFGSNSLSLTNTQGDGNEALTPARGVSTYIIGELFSKEDFHVLLLLFIYSILYLCSYVLIYLAHILDYHPILHYLFYCLNCSHFGYWGLFQVGFCVLWACPIPLFLEHFLTFRYYWMVWLILYFPALAPKSSTSPFIEEWY